jgi:hypothetical protein
MGSVFKALERLRFRSGMYLGESESMLRLELFIVGYSVAVLEHEVRDEEEVQDFRREFRDYLHTRLGWMPDSGPFAAVEMTHKGPETVWEYLFSLIDDFRADLARKRSQQPG